MDAVKGWKTLLWNGGFAAVVGLLTYLAGVDWTMHVDPTIAMFLVAAVNVGLRVVTTTPIGKSE